MARFDLLRTANVNTHRRTCMTLARATVDAPALPKSRAEIDATKQYKILAQDDSATGVKARPNDFPKAATKETTLDQIGKSLHEHGKFGAGHGQQIRLEVHGSQTSFPPYCKTIM